MKLKSLLLGSAAALVAVSGARAADAIIAEPEPVEYVRVCDAYGAGYFYIPGTETCLKIGGFVRYQIHASDATDGWSKRTRYRVELNAKNESDLGTVSSYIRIDHTTIDGVQGFWNNQYSLGVGGFEAGHRDSQWNRFSGYGGLTDDGGSYGYQERHYISYTFASDGFSGIISLDHDQTDTDYVPDVMLGVGGTLGAAKVTLSAGYDTSAEEGTIKATLNAPIGPATLRLVGLYATGVNAYWSGSANNDWSVIVGVGAPLSEKLSAAVDFQYFSNDTGLNAAGDWRIVGDVNYTIATGLTSLLEVAHTDSGSTSGFLRLQRSF